MNGPCLDEGLLLELSQGLLGAAALAAAEHHLRDCPICALTLAELASTGDGHSLGEGERPTLDDPSVARPPGPEDDLALSPGALISRYQLIDRIGTGGMGTVFSAYDPELDRKVALKVLRGGRDGDPVLGPELRVRLVREAQALARLAHPNVIHVYDVGTYEGRVFLAMELVTGGHLGGWLTSQRRGWREVLAAFMAAGRGLAAAHAAGLVHRDFKPENVLVGSDGRMRVTDFGLARPAQKDFEGTPLPVSTGWPEPSNRVLNQPLTRDGAVLGTPAYMALEQLLGGKPDPRTDQFSFCVALYEALYRQRPFEGRTPFALAMAIESGKLRPPPLSAGLPFALYRALRRGLSARQADRFPDVDALLRALRRAAGLRLRWGLAAAITTATALVALGSRLVPGTVSPCEETSRRWTEGWSARAQDRLRSSFERAGATPGRTALVEVGEALDAVGGRWRGTLRTACLDDPEGASACGEAGDAHLATLLEELARVDAAALPMAASAAAELEDWLTCVPSVAAAQNGAPPHPKTALRHALARAAVLRTLGRPSAAAAIIAPLAEEPPTGDLGLDALLAYEKGLVELSRGRVPQAILLLQTAGARALSASDGSLQVRAWGELARALAGTGAPAAALPWAELAHAAAQRSGRRPLDEARGLAALARVRLASGRPDLATPLYEQTLALLDRQGRLRTEEGARARLELAESRGLSRPREQRGSP